MSKFANELIDWRLLGIRPINSKRSPIMNPSETNTKVIGVAMSQNFLDKINQLASEKYPEKKYPRSKFLREMIEIGIKNQEKEGGEA